MFPAKERVKRGEMEYQNTYVFDNTEIIISHFLFSLMTNILTANKLISSIKKIIQS